MIRTPDAFAPTRAWSPAANRSESVRLPAAAVIKTMKKTTASFLTRGLGSGVGVEVREGRCEAVGQRLQEQHNLVFFVIRQTEIADGHVFRSWNLRHRPAVDLFRSTWWTVPDRDVERETWLVPGVVEVHDLLQALQIAVVHIRFD